MKFYLKTTIIFIVTMLLVASSTWLLVKNQKEDVRIQKEEGSDFSFISITF